MEQKFGKNSIDIKVLREFCKREGKMVEYRKGEQLERYERLLQRCPGIVEHLDLQDIASFLNVTPKTISMIWKQVFGIVILINTVQRYFFYFIGQNISQENGSFRVPSFLSAVAPIRKSTPAPSNSGIYSVSGIRRATPQASTSSMAKRWLLSK